MPVDALVCWQDINAMSDISDIPPEFGANDDIMFTRKGTAIDVRLTRPKALNALTHNMAKALHAGLRAWANDTSITHVVISADIGDKPAFCAGGDIRDLYNGFKAGTPRHDFFRDEYRLNEQVATFPKPYIALMNGMVMGGGAGLSIHGSHRIVTENAKFAMPEVSIGLIPDVGGSYVLPRLPNQSGLFLGLTATKIGPEDCLEAGIATHFCNASEIEDLRIKLLHSEQPLHSLENLRSKPAPSRLAASALDHAQIFSADTLAEVFSRLHHMSDANDFLAGALKGMKSASPLSLCLAFEQLKRGRNLSLRDGLIMEYRLVSRILHGPDLYAGIHAAIIDRSAPPKWQHDSFAEVDTALIDSFFNPPPEGDLTFEN
jgi:enoyl-CoA hydratase